MNMNAKCIELSKLGMCTAFPIQSAALINITRVIYEMNVMYKLYTYISIYMAMHTV